MIEEIARVVEVNENYVVLEKETASTCGSCAVRSGCGTSVLSKWIGKKFTTFRARNTLETNVGDKVVVGLQETAVLRGSLALYLLPLILMIVFAVFVEYAFSASSIYSELWVVIGAITGFFLGLKFGRKYLAGKTCSDELNPVILRKIREHVNIHQT